MGEEPDTFAAVVWNWLWDVDYFVEPYQSGIPASGSPCDKE